MIFLKEAIGTSFVFNLIMVFVSVFIVLYVGSIAYSKGFKIRNRIIDIIESNSGYNGHAILLIDENLAAIGYQLSNRDCPIKEKGNMVNVTSAYNYCIYQYDTVKGDYYGVTVFIKFDIPLIGSYVQVPIYGETRIIFDKDKVEG